MTTTEEEGGDSKLQQCQVSRASERKGIDQTWPAFAAERATDAAPMH